MCGVEKRCTFRRHPSALAPSSSFCPSSAVLMAAVTGNDSAATEHTEEPQLAELLNQEAGLTSEIELKVVHNQVIDYSYKANNGAQVTSQRYNLSCNPKFQNNIAWVSPKSRKKQETKLSSRKFRTAGRQVPRGSLKPSSSSTRSPPVFTPHAASQSICATLRPKRCYRARASQKHQCQESPSQTYCN